VRPAGRAAKCYDEKRGRMPNPLLINVRKIDVDEKRVTVAVDSDRADYEP
jgi:hypothetical protein